MEMVIKQTIRIGNSSGVLLPKKWEYKKVRVELIEDSIADRVFDIIKKKDLLEDVMGIYLVGSYARGEERVDSDIDMLVITGNTNMFLKEGSYEILFISKERLDKNLEKSLYLCSMIKEAKAICNKELIKRYKEFGCGLILEKLIREIKSVMKINEESIEISEDIGERVRDGVVYSMILRLRELSLISSIIDSKVYSNNNFLKIIEKRGFLDLYRAYLRIKSSMKPVNNSKVEDAKKLIIYIRDMIKKVENGKKRKKTS